MPADPTIQNALIVIATMISIQTLLLICTVIAMAVAWRRAHTMIDAQLGRFGARFDDVVSQTRMAAGAIERSAAQVDNALNDARHILRGVVSAVGAPRAWLMAGAASAAGVFARWRRSRREETPETSARRAHDHSS
jgi:hypothetical protein